MLNAVFIYRVFISSQLNSTLWLKYYLPDWEAGLSTRFPWLTVPEFISLWEPHHCFFSKWSDHAHGSPLSCQGAWGLKLQVFISNFPFLDYRELWVVYSIIIRATLCKFRQDLGQHVCLIRNIKKPWTHFSPNQHNYNPRDVAFLTSLVELSSPVTDKTFFPHGTQCHHFPFLPLHSHFPWFLDIHVVILVLKILCEHDYKMRFIPSPLLRMLKTCSRLLLTTSLSTVLSHLST